MQITKVDRIGQVRAEWGREEPGLDTAPMEVIGRILRVAHLADARIRKVLREEGLDRGSLDVLATLRRSGPPYRLTPTQLYQELVITSGAMTHRIDALVRAGLAQRIADPADRRSTLVGLTSRGRELAGQAMAAHMRCEATMTCLLPPTERETLAALLARLLHGMEEQT